MTSWLLCIRLTLPGVVDRFNQKSSQYSDCPPPHCPDDSCPNQRRVCRAHHDERPAADNVCPVGCQNKPDPTLHTCEQHNPRAFETRFLRVVVAKNLHQHTQTCRKGPRGCEMCRYDQDHCRTHAHVSLGDCSLELPLVLDDAAWHTRKLPTTKARAANCSCRSCHPSRSMPMGQRQHPTQPTTSQMLNHPTH